MDPLRYVFSYKEASAMVDQVKMISVAYGLWNSELACYIRLSYIPDLLGLSVLIVVYL